MTAVPHTSDRTTLRTTVAEPVAAATAAPTSDDLWVTRLFSDTGAGVSTTTTSATAAYQDAIYDRLVIVDLRTARSRTEQGIIADGLAQIVNPATPDGYAHLLTLAATTPVTLLGDSALVTSRLAAHLTGLGLAEATVLHGGFAAWRAAGMPVD